MNTVLSVTSYFNDWKAKLVFLYLSVTFSHCAYSLNITGIDFPNKKAQASRLDQKAESSRHGNKHPQSQQREVELCEFEVASST